MGTVWMKHPPPSQHVIPPSCHPSPPPPPPESRARAGVAVGLQWLRLALRARKDGFTAQGTKLQSSNRTRNLPPPPHRVRISGIFFAAMRE